jgi:NAD+ synthase
MKNKSEKIIVWLRKIYGERPAVIAVSGGVDSALALTLLIRALGRDKVVPILLPYLDQDMTDAQLIVEWNGLTEKAEEVNIGEMVATMTNALKVPESSLRQGNLMARARMMVVYDYAKKMGALVSGTENKSEHYLGYFTRFGDAASDVEPIAGLYKTEVWEMAKELGLPEVFYTKSPSAGLWEGQTDEEEMGFTYREADLVLQGKESEVDPEVVARVRARVEAQKFKLEVPYTFH